MVKKKFPCTGLRPVSIYRMLSAARYIQEWVLQRAQVEGARILRLAFQHQVPFCHPSTLSHFTTSTFSRHRLWCPPSNSFITSDILHKFTVIGSDVLHLYTASPLTSSIHLIQHSDLIYLSALLPVTSCIHLRHQFWRSPLIFFIIFDVLLTSTSPPLTIFTHIRHQTWRHPPIYFMTSDAIYITTSPPLMSLIHRLHRLLRFPLALQRGEQLHKPLTLFPLISPMKNTP